MPVFQGERVEQEQQQRRVFKGERVNQPPPDRPSLTADRGVRDEGRGAPIGGGMRLPDEPAQMPAEWTSLSGLLGTGAQVAAGAGEFAVSALSSAVAEPIAGFAGLAEMASTELLRDPSSSSLERSVASINAVRDALTYRPRTKVGQRLSQVLAEDPKIQEILTAARRGGEAAAEATDSPAVGAASQTALELIPGALTPSARFGVRGVRGQGFEASTPSELAPQTPSGPTIQDLPATGKARKQDLRRVESALEGAKVDITSRRNLLNTIDKLANDVQRPGFASSLEAVNEALIRAKGVEKQTENVLWEQARQGPSAGVPRQDMLRFEAQLDEALDGFVIEEMGSFNKLRQQLEEGVANAPPGSAVKLEALMNWRKALNRNMPSQKSPEQKVFSIAKRNLDNFLQTEFATDMIKGDPESLARWQAAINKSAEFREVFEDDKIIRQLANHEATPEELRNLMFNASAAGAKATAARTARKLKRIFGENSDEIVALRQESLYNVMEPLVSETPDFAKFQSNYERFMKKNPGLVKELFTENSRDQLQALYSASKSARTRQAIEKRTGKDIRDIAAVGLFGHGIAQAGLRVRLARDIFSTMMRAKNDTIKREVMRDFLGYDATKELFSSPAKRAIVLEGMIQGQKEEQE